VSDLYRTVAVVTGASRGLGKAMALGLGELGATVYVTGRSTDARPGLLAGTVDQTAAGVSAAGGVGLAVACDQRVDAEIAAVIDRVVREQGRVDVLVNCAQASPEPRVLWGGRRFWQLSFDLWDDLVDVGLRSHFVASALAARNMIEHGRGLIVNVASHAAGGGKTSPQSGAIMPYSVAKAGLRRLTSDMAVELSGTGVGVLEVWPPASRTEAVLAQADVFGDLTGWHEPIFSGRVLAALVAAGDWHTHTGQPVVLEEVASDLGVPVPP
jgi:NAD(P)-dependent dehydrogenase (short-subunit alcohol dehydrogenase family)